MEFEPDEQHWEPVSPTAQYLRSRALSVTILGVLETEVPFDDSNIMQSLKDTFLPKNHRFSSVMVTGKEGQKIWKKVEVDLKEHVYVPSFPDEMSVEYYDQCFTDYLSKVSMEQYPPDRPLWELHIIKYPTKNAPSSLIFKLHHSLGDGYSLMGALLSCLKRMDDPSMPLTFPSRQSSSGTNKEYRFFKNIPRLFTGVFQSAYDFGWSLLKSSLIPDDKSAIRSDENGVEFQPVVTYTTSFSMDQLRKIKSSIKVTINDVITGIIFYGVRLYMQNASQESSQGKGKTTTLVLLNTRALGGYKSVSEMVKSNAEMPWGNRFAFLPVPVPELTDSELQNPLSFVKSAHKTIKRQRNSASVYLTGQFLDLTGKLRGPEASARCVHGSLKNTSLAISNLTGPVEKMSLNNQPVKGLYFAVTGTPESLTATIVSYVGKLTLAMTTQKGFIDTNKLRSCIEHAFEAIYKAALNSMAQETKN